jgi:hypothetical protein
MEKQPLGWELTKEGWSPDLDFEAPMPGMIAISTINGYGDLKKIWNAANADEVEDAKRTFNHLVKEKKYLAFRVNDEGKKGEQIREFNSEAGKMILIPPMAGG